MPAEATVAQASASWLSGGLFQRLIVLQAAPSFGQPRPISRWVRPGLWACFRHIAWCVRGSSMSGSSLVTEGHSTALPFTAGTVRLRSVKRVPPPASGVDRYMKKV